MNPEYKGLIGHSLLIVESELLAATIGDCFTNHKMKFIELQSNVPKNLAQYLKANNIDIALIHTAILSDKEEILDASRNGNKMVIIKRDSPTTYEEMDMYECFENVGIVTIPKSLYIAERSVELVNKLLQE